MLYLIAGVGLVLFFLLVYFFLQSDPGLSEKVQELLAQGRYQEALQLLDLEKIRSIGDPQLYYQRLRCFEELQQPKEALETLHEIRRLGKYPSALGIPELYRKIAFYTKLCEDEESAFEAYLNLLQVVPEDSEALRELGLWAGRAHELEIALHFMDRAYAQKVFDGEFLKVYAAVLYEAGREAKAFEVISELMSRYPDEDAYAYLFVLMSGKSHFSEAKKKILDLLPKTIDEMKKVWLGRIYVNACIKQKAYTEACQFLERLVAEHHLPEDYLVEFKYFALLFYLQEQNFQKAAHLYEELSSLRTSYAQLDKIRYYIDYIDLHPPLENAIPFEKLFEETFQNLLPANLFYSESGIFQEVRIDFSKYFEIRDGGVSLKGDYAIPTPEWAMSRFMSYSRDELPLFIRQVAESLGYRILQQEALSESEALDFTAAHKGQPSQKALFSLRRFRDQTQLSDIFLANYRNRMGTLSCQKGFILSNAQLTLAAEESLKKNRDIEFFSGQRLVEHVLSYEKNKRKALAK
ncbi:MAG: hypothetical protein NZM25_02845 [Leptospiraceae bacterium]|nr:hypothetical protein [Leptospiraceae bacterium]MDW8307206.1 hypothetical protein [Leptospiraceae bacterium]